MYLQLADAEQIQDETWCLAALLIYCLDLYYEEDNAKWLTERSTTASSLIQCSDWRL
jgi:hypothetical protein